MEGPIVLLSVFESGSKMSLCSALSLEPNSSLLKEPTTGGWMERALVKLLENRISLHSDMDSELQSEQPISSYLVVEIERK